MKVDKKIKKKFIFINGSWVDDDIDVFPNIKIRIGKREKTNITLKGFLIALCWLKWGVGFFYGFSTKIKK